MAVRFDFESLPDEALIRQHQLVAPAGSGALAILPFSATTLWRKVKTGGFPAPQKISGNITAWRVGAIREWLRSTAEGSSTRG